VAIGLITAMFGIRGEVKVQPLTDFPERFFKTATVYVGDALVERRVLGARLHQRIVILRIEGVETANDAEALRNKKLYIPASEGSHASRQITTTIDHVFIGLRMSSSMWTERR
jgi:16S rRNA processing protein RimM